MESASELVSALVIFLTWFSISAVSGVTALRFMSLAYSNGTSIDALARAAGQDVINGIVWLQELVPPESDSDGDSDWPVYMQYPIFGMIFVPILCFTIFLLMVAWRALQEGRANNGPRTSTRPATATKAAA